MEFVRVGKIAVEFPLGSNVRSPRRLWLGQPTFRGGVANGKILSRSDVKAAGPGPCSGRYIGTSPSPYVVSPLKGLAMSLSGMGRNPSRAIDLRGISHREAIVCEVDKYLSIF